MVIGPYRATTAAAALVNGMTISRQAKHPLYLLLFLSFSDVCVDVLSITAILSNSPPVRRWTAV
ncbi:hypothetical protein EON65_18410 [archaeon]|nr:MAG: hypothetical protein EON65_18410 [archaeon]